jgi:neurobeachin-like protein 1/2
VSEVQLPKWVKSQLPEEYVFLMREALESPYVSENLNEWINLIFGCYQDSFEKDNQFIKFSYEGLDSFI